MANPYLYIAAQIHCRPDGLQRRPRPPDRRTDSPYAAGERLPAGLDEALRALAADAVLCAAFGAPLVSCSRRVKRSELERHDAAERQGRLDAARILQPVLTRDGENHDPSAQP